MLIDICLITKKKSNETMQHYHKNMPKVFSCAQPVFSLAKSAS